MAWPEFELESGQRRMYDFHRNILVGSSNRSKIYSTVFNVLISMLTNPFINRNGH